MRSTIQNILEALFCLAAVAIVGSFAPRSTIDRTQTARGKPNYDADPTASIFFESEETWNASVSQWTGAGPPRPELAVEEIPPLLMMSLKMNDIPQKDAGLTSVWEFAGDTTRHIFQHNLSEFIESAHETANTMRTSFYGAAMNGKEWIMETPINRVGGDSGWIATQVMKTVSEDGRVRRWQWELRKQRRPPNLGAWYVENIGSSDRKGNFEPE